jgi:hypothetical protein
MGIAHTPRALISPRASPCRILFYQQLITHRRLRLLNHCLALRCIKCVSATAPLKSNKLSLNEGETNRRRGILYISGLKKIETCERNSLSCSYILWRICGEKDLSQGKILDPRRAYQFHEGGSQGLYFLFLRSRCCVRD